jgi:hypothetical protein
VSEELGQIEKPSVEEFRSGRKLYFVPLIYCGKEALSEYVERFNDYWKQVDDQISALELKLGNVHKILHELITANGEEGAKAIEELNDKSYEIVKKRLDAGAQIEALEDSELVAELMDWSRCLSVGLQSQKAFTSIYGSYTEASKSRNEYIAKQINEMLNADEIGLLFMREGHQVQFPQDIEVFYVAPPGLHEIRRWLRDNQPKQEEEAPDNKN